MRRAISDGKVIHGGVVGVFKPGYSEWQNIVERSFMVVGFKKGSNIWFIGNVAEGGNVSSASFEIIKPFGGMNEVIGVGIDLARSDGEGNVFRVETICCDGAGVGARCDFVGTIR